MASICMGHEWTQIDSDMTAKTRRPRRSFGSVRKLPSGALQARYTGPDEVTYKAPVTFSTYGDADTWLAGSMRTSRGRSGSARRYGR